MELVYKGPRVIEPHIDGPIAQPAQKRRCKKVHFISFNFKELKFLLVFDVVSAKITITFKVDKCVAHEY